jgi:ribosomal protein S18 acetylase RimI-like enzyme
VTPPVIRRARPADERRLAELDAVAWSAESGFPSVIAAPGPSGFFSAEHPPQAHLVADIDGRIAGYLRIEAATRLPENAHVLVVNGFAVHPDLRRHGIGSLLLQAAGDHARAAGARKLTLRVLSSNRGAIALYAQRGFTREGVLRGEFLIEGDYVDDVLMAKFLGSDGGPATWAAGADGLRGPAGTDR